MNAIRGLIFFAFMFLAILGESSCFVTTMLAAGVILVSLGPKWLIFHGWPSVHQYVGVGLLAVLALSQWAKKVRILS